MENNGFYTIRGYQQRETSTITHTMEDYLEMIYRRTQEGKVVRINQLAALLHVKPSSASKMAAKLRESGMVEFESYGFIELTSKGQKAGAYLIHRHEVLHQLFCQINGSGDELALVEQIEHFVDNKTVQNIERLLAKWNG